MPKSEKIYDLQLGPWVGAFLLISALAHFYLATVGYEKYIANLKKGMNPLQFCEYALSSSLMIVLIGLLSGLWDLGAIILLFGLNAMVNLFGDIMEKQNQTTRSDGLDRLHLRLYSRHHPLDRDLRLLRGLRQLR